jgi:C4-dicarboxylate-specific signal transduction histidine kinase
LMQQVVKTINNVNETLRRGYTKYQKLRAEQDADITSQDVEQTFNQMREAGNKSQDLVDIVATSRQKLDETSQHVEIISGEVNNSPLFHTDEERRIAPLLQEINLSLMDAKSILNQVQEILFQTQKLGSIADVLQPDIENLRDQLLQFSELAGLGLTAEALSHEMKIIADGLDARTTNLVKQLSANKSINPQVLAYSEFIHSTIAGFRKQLTHLDPSLRYVREKQEEISLKVFFNETQEFYRERLKRNTIKLVVIKPNKDFMILLNKGKLTQVIDNLIINSEYWLIEDLRKGFIEKGEIIINISKPFVEVYDNGHGVSSSVEHQLFQPFVTTKPKGVGRGLGLFICRQLLESSNCQISLLPTKNQFDRRYIFRIDFSGAINGR